MMLIKGMVRRERSVNARFDFATTIVIRAIFLGLDFPELRRTSEGTGISNTDATPFT